MDYEAIIKLQEAVMRLSAALKGASEGITSLAAASGKHSVGLVATQIAIKALLEDAAQEPQRAAHLQATLMRLAEENQVRLLYAAASDDLMNQLPHVLNALLPPQIQPL
ncbi:hypothetical protein [Achromobacter xylosoxidans]|nr:hypothetical protein [Achromobacter xylosoxidans]